MVNCKICGSSGYHYCPKLDTFADAADINYQYEKRVSKNHDGLIGGAIVGGIIDGLGGAVVGGLLGSLLDD